MGFPKLLVAWVAISIALVAVWAEEEVEIGGAPDLSTKLELERLRAEISALEKSIAERTGELKTKDETIAKLESTIQDKSQRIASLQDEIETIRKKGALDAEEKAGKAYARASELEKQIERLRNEFELKNSLRNALEARANEAEKKVRELTKKLESLQSSSDEQKRRTLIIEQALQAAEEELMRVQLEATSKSKELREAHRAWLPHWLATYISYCQELASTHWNEHAKPTLDIFLQKASEKSIQVKKWAEPHLETAKTKWIPVVKEQWLVFITTAKPYVHTASSKAVEIYEASKNAITPHVAKVQDFADPYFQETKKLSKPYVDQVAKFAKPHVEKVRIVAKPYSEQVVRAYGKFLKSANIYHRQVQGTILDHLEKHEITKPLATKELVWFMASALLASPVFIVYKLLTDILWSKKGRKPTQNANKNHVHRRHKRRHAEK
uniref:Uncharacterized protein n=1 Tax=Ananas comosus var. bracteatus TaxID=296719 RepID=A0A6V7P458_ANACO|nr:unnamed protein product [Ananas comosus var. bracteatus]